MKWAVLACILLFGIMVGTSWLLGASNPLAQECVTNQDRDRIRELSLAAIDQALMNHVAKLFDVWLKDFSPEPKRATAGMANGISAYNRARANALNWNPLTCRE